jgi:hypothetical protein
MQLLVEVVAVAKRSMPGEKLIEHVDRAPVWQAFNLVIR